MKFKEIPQFTSVGSYQVNMPLTYITQRVKEWVEDEYYKLQLNPDFQRGNVWTEEQQSAYMEYLLKGGQSAKLYILICLVGKENKQQIIMILYVLMDYRD